MHVYLARRGGVACFLLFSVVRDAHAYECAWRRVLAVPNHSTHLTIINTHRLSHSTSVVEQTWWARDADGNARCNTPIRAHTVTLRGRDRSRAQKSSSCFLLREALSIIAHRVGAIPAARRESTDTVTHGVCRFPTGTACFTQPWCGTPAPCLLNVAVYRCTLRRRAVAAANPF